ncbi:MAG: prepilin-type N-terminal cleavage/methylation domain-containing protein [Myxococcota bacterium]|nr:prepilin-type N-terminal cleavage/methylation domain-containing protein [Myxococcota bacterium]
MRSHRRSRAFTLVEAMIVVALVGVLAVLATVAYRRWIRTSHVAEGEDVVSSIRSAEESFFAEHGGYLNVSVGLGPPNDYPAATPGAFKTAWGGPCSTCVTAAAWTSLNVKPSGPVYFGYSLTAGDGVASSPPANITVNGSALSLSAMNGKPWYVIEADSNTSGDGVRWTRVFGISGNNRILVSDEGE